MTQLEAKVVFLNEMLVHHRLRLIPNHLPYFESKFLLPKSPIQQPEKGLYPNLPNCSPACKPLGHHAIYSFCIKQFPPKFTS